MLFRTFTDYNHKKFFSADKILLQKYNSNNQIISSRNNYILDLTLSTFNNLIPKPKNLESFIKNKLTCNRINRKLKSTYFPTPLSKSRTQINFNSLSSYKTIKKTKSSLYSISKNSPKSLKKIINKIKAYYESNKSNSRNSKYNHIMKNSFLNNKHDSLNLKQSVNKPMINFDKIYYRHLFNNNGSPLYQINFDKSFKVLSLFRKNKINNIKTMEKFKNKLLSEKRSDKREYISYMDELQKNLEKSRSKSKPKSKFGY